MSWAHGLGRLLAALGPDNAPSEMRCLAAELKRVLGQRIGTTPVGVRQLAEALCEEMSRRRAERPIQLRFERIPDEFEVTGLWIEFHDFDLVVIEERAEEVQQLVILGHELWHIQQGHRHRRVNATAAAVRTLADGTGWPEIALTVAARSGSHAADEAEAEEFGMRLASAFRRRLDPRSGPERTPLDPVGRAIQASLGYRGPQD
ncbi:toxin-antitoxin system, toxin component family protein [Streptomyces sp. NPDC050535]|uniref:toxin-antitoxin system, toxin component family protein n=1 Tax=Streptomyces sp. NPDC050535 TaxID=3365626 RepID=UPI0037B145FC